MEVIGDHQEGDVGELPAGWRIVPLGKLVASVEYGSSAKSRPSGEVPVLRMGNLQDGKLVWDDLVYTDSKAEIGKYFLTPGDVLFNRTNTIDLVGKTSLYLGERPAIFAGYLIRITVEESKLDARYLNYILNTRASKRYSAKVLSVAVGQANINGKKLRTYPIPLPPTRAEQEAIAEALSDADALIESLEQLLAKKRQIKQGAMQKLLTGKKRLPGFGGEWFRVRMREILSQPATYGIVTAGDFVLDGIKMLRGGDIEDGRINTDLPMVTREKAIEYSRTKLIKDDVVIALVGYPGATAKIPGELIGANISRAVGLLRLNGKVKPEYLVCFLNSIEGRKIVLAPSAGSAQQVVNLAALNRLEFHVPEHSEQSAIADVFFGMEAEILEMEQKLNKARQIKQGMMQELLTGRIRLV